MWQSITVLIILTLLVFYLEAICQRILRRRFGDELFHSVVDARLEFPFVRKALEEFDVPLDYKRFRMQLKCDFLALTYLLKTKQRFSNEERLLLGYFRAVFFVLWIRHKLGLSERDTVLTLTSILEYFANALWVTPMKVDQHEPRLRTHARWCLASFVGMVCILYSAVLGAFSPGITTFPAFPVLLVLVCLLFLIIGGTR
jgi:hypothetical protein